ncbi:MAG: acylphosphatase [Candidatus Micrarchaeota archaeon]|jgi:acylphosphatase
MKVRLIAKGIVQGVGFRYFVRGRALKNNIKGIVRNLPDGSVEIFAEGDEGNLSNFIEEIRFAEGSLASVDELDIYREGEIGFKEPWKEYGDKFIIDK